MANPFHVAELAANPSALPRLNTTADLSAETGMFQAAVEATLTIKPTEKGLMTTHSVTVQTGTRRDVADGEVVFERVYRDGIA